MIAKLLRYELRFILRCTVRSIVPGVKILLYLSAEFGRFMYLVGHFMHFELAAQPRAIYLGASLPGVVVSTPEAQYGTI